MNQLNQPPPSLNLEKSTKKGLKNELNSENS